MMDEIFLRILDMTKTGSLVILAVLLARLLLKKAPKIFSYALWAVVLFRLLCPVSFEAPVSLLPEQEPVAQSYDLAEEPISVVGAGIAAYHVVGDALNGGLGVQHVPTTQRDAGGNVEYVSTDWRNVLLLSGQYIWIAGVAVMALYSGISYWKLRRKLKVTIPLRDNIFLADDIRSPFVIGFVRPKIYLPNGLGGQEQEYIILHEQQHIRRLDPLIKMLAYAALCLHWFNPLVWLAFVLACRDMEMSCDEAVLKRSGVDIRADYAASLLTLATGRHIIAGTPLAFGEGDPKGRIKNLAKWKKPAIWVTAIAAVLCIILGVCLIADPTSGESNTLMGGYYSVDGILYNVTEDDSAEFDRILVTADYRLYCHETGADYWLSGRDMEAYPLTEKELKQYTAAEVGWKENYRIGKIVDAYIVRMENDYFYLVIRTKGGDTLLGLGWEDVSERNDPYSDDTSLRWLYKLQPQELEDEEVENFVVLSLYASVGVTEPFGIWESEKNPGYTVAGFLADPRSGGEQDYYDMGFAVFHSSGTGYRLLSYHVYDDAALIENGIYFCPHPAVLSLDGTATDSNSFDVILSVNPAFSKIQREYYQDDTLVHTVTVQLSGAPAMSLFSWDECMEANRVKQYYLDTEGNIIEDTGIFLTEDRLAEGVYIPTECLYMNALSSYYPYNISEDYQYTVTADSFITQGLLIENGINILSVDWHWQTLEEAEAALAFLKGTPYYDRLVTEGCLYQQLDALNFLLQSNDKLYLVRRGPGEEVLWYIYILEPEQENLTLSDRIEELFLIIRSSPAQYSMPGPYIEAHEAEYQELLSYGEDTLQYCFREFTSSGQKGLLELLMALACEEILETMGEQDFPAVEGHGTGSQWFNHFAEYAQLLAQEKSSEEIKRDHPGAWLYLQILRPEMSFAELAPEAMAVDPEYIQISQDGSSLYYSLSYASPASILEIGLQGEDGTVISRTVEDGHASGTFRDIPAGTYRLFVRNAGYVNGLPGQPVTGAMVCTLRGGVTE